jgi:ABC-type taurine transport system ATPase subunit
MPEKTILDLIDVSVQFDTDEGPMNALERINLCAQEGEFICVVGPSGCGKTTLLRIIAGFIFPTCGVACVEGKPITGPSWHRGMVFQHPALYPWLNVFENVEFGPKMRGVAKGQRREQVEFYLKMVGLWDFRNRPPYELSGGMQQRVAIARVLVNDPQMLLMDEPFGALDALTREYLQEELLRIWRETNKTVFFITHSVEEAVYLATVIVVLSPRPGRIIAHLPSPFSRGYIDQDSRAVKSSPEFVQLREQVLGFIWH